MKLFLTKIWADIVAFGFSLAKKFSRPRISKAEWLRIKEYEKQEDENAKVFQQLAIEDGVALSKYFRESLLVGLPHHLQGLGTYFQDFPLEDEKYQKHLYSLDGEDQVRRAGEPHATQLLQYGLKIEDLFYVSVALNGLLNRMRERGFWYDFENCAFDLNKHVALSPKFQEFVVREIAMMVYDQTDKKTLFCAKKLLEWVIEVLQFKPLFLRDYKAIFENGIMKFAPDEGFLVGLDARWKVHRESH